MSETFGKKTGSRKDARPEPGTGYPVEDDGCPSQEQLDRYRVGRLEDLEAEALEAHLDGCPHCHRNITGQETLPKPTRLTPGQVWGAGLLVLGIDHGETPPKAFTQVKNALKSHGFTLTDQDDELLLATLEVGTGETGASPLHAARVAHALQAILPLVPQNAPFGVLAQVSRGFHGLEGPWGPAVEEVVTLRHRIRAGMVLLAPALSAELSPLGMKVQREPLEAPFCRLISASQATTIRRVSLPSPLGAPRHALVHWLDDHLDSFTGVDLAVHPVRVRRALAPQATAPLDHGLTSGDHLTIQFVAPSDANVYLILASQTPDGQAPDGQAPDVQSSPHLTPQSPQPPPPTPTRLSPPAGPEPLRTPQDPPAGSLELVLDDRPGLEQPLLLCTRSPMPSLATLLAHLNQGEPTPRPGPDPVFTGPWFGRRSDEQSQA